jgi:hypothetical protein
MEDDTMTDMYDRVPGLTEEVKQWLAIRAEAAKHIDPTTAEVEWSYAQTLDPYGVVPELPEEYQQVGRAYFARSPGSDVWVCFYDLEVTPWLLK